MTEECKYKFRDKDKFNGKEYCTLFNELCEEVSFVCDKNCQVYEDFKQLKRLQAENEELKIATDNLLKIQYALADSCNKYIKALEEIREMLGSQVWAIGDDDTVEEIRNKIDEVLK